MSRIQDQFAAAWQQLEDERRKGRPLNHAQPALPVQAYKAFHLLSPPSTHFRVGTCEEAGCVAYREGWASRIDTTTDLGAAQAYYIRKQSGRKFVETKEPTGLTLFAFEAGQKCFRTHQVSLERPEFLAVGRGDWRQYTKPRLHSGPDAFVNDFGEHQDRIHRAING